MGPILRVSAVSLDMVMHDDGISADLRVVTANCDVTVEVRQRTLFLKGSRRYVERYVVQPPGAEEPWTTHLSAEGALIAGLRKARRIERAYKKLERNRP